MAVLLAAALAGTFVLAGCVAPKDRAVRATTTTTEAHSGTADESTGRPSPTTFGGERIGDGDHGHVEQGPAALDAACRKMAVTWPARLGSNAEEARAKLAADPEGYMREVQIVAGEVVAEIYTYVPEGERQAMVDAGSGIRDEVIGVKLGLQDGNDAYIQKSVALIAQAEAAFNAEVERYGAPSCRL